MRELVLDTETTGLSPTRGDRLVEVACVEIVNFVPTGRFYHTYINPQRDVSKEAEAVHGLNWGFLKDYPLFSEIAEDFLNFIQGDQLVIHNAEFDLRFLNAELGALKKNFLENSVVDTLQIARKKFPGSPASLDALCRRFQIDNSHRDKHGALLDCHLLSSVYLELSGGKQPGFDLDQKTASLETGGDILDLYKDKPLRPSRNFLSSFLQKVE